MPSYWRPAQDFSQPTLQQQLQVLAFQLQQALQQHQVLLRQLHGQGQHGRGGGAMVKQLQALAIQLQQALQQQQALSQQLHGQEQHGWRGGDPTKEPAPASKARSAQACHQQMPGPPGSGGGPGTTAVRAPAPTQANAPAGGLAQQGPLPQAPQTGTSSGLPRQQQQHQPARPAPFPAGPWPLAQGKQAMHPQQQQQQPQQHGQQPHPRQQPAMAVGSSAGHSLSPGLPKRQAPAAAMLPLAATLTPLADSSGTQIASSGNGYMTFLGQPVRIDTATGRASVYDVLHIVTGVSRGRLSHCLADLQNTHAGLEDKVERLKINGQAPITPVADASTLIELIMMVRISAASA